MCSCPYRNDRIINAIRELYFTEGHTLFAYCFRYLFPSCDCCDNIARLEVPIPMVALVATAVSFSPIQWHYIELNISSMPRSMSGIMASTKARISLLIRTWMFTKAMSTRCMRFWPSRVLHSIQWWLIYISKQGGLIIFTTGYRCDINYKSITAPHLLPLDQPLAHPVLQ